MPKQSPPNHETVYVPGTDLQDIFNNAPIGIFTTTPSGRITSANLFLARMFGYDSPKELIESTKDIATQFYADPEDRKEFIRLLKEHGEVTNHECRFQRRDRTEIWGSRSARVIKDQKGRIVAYQGFHADITDRKQAEEAFRKSLTRYDELVANVPVGVYIFWHRVNGHLEFEYVSNRWCEIHQVKREDVLADVMKVNSQVHPDEQEDFLVRNQKSFRDRIPFIWEGQFFIGDGNLRWLRIESTPIVFDNGDIRWFGVTSDITDRKQAELALSRNQKIMAQAEELADLGSWEWDIKNDTWQMSDNWKRIHGVHDTQLTTPQLLPIAHPEDRPAIKEAFARACQNGEPYEIEHRIVRQDTGEVRYVHSRGLVVMDDKKKPGTLVGAVQDITERKKAENKIGQVNQELRKSNFEKDKLFSIIAHDLRSPLAGLLTSTETLARKPESFPEQDLKFLATVLHNNTRNAFNLLEDLLQWSRMSHGGIDYAPTPSCLNDLITMGLTTVQEMARAKDIAIRNDVPPGMTVLADQPMLKTVIRNILFNAIKFTHRGGEIVIKAHQVGQTVTATIQDNGIGMNEQVMSSAFFLGKEKRQLGTESEKGTGLGLILCKQFIEQHGGEIWMESEVGKGTTVFFTLSVYD
ncbi:sensor histidine kinase [Desulfonatronum thioautotrophicum]|uniref:sensor histidine kinase n=1 Tax=Desulfonatronum thioautotrophicum TaxID=617001 RepID=UPI00069C028F|nr:PAS domain-containing sensor histidine kinase [Desulfonatronum thioautotrophicum]